MYKVKNVIKINSLTPNETMNCSKTKAYRIIKELKE